MTSVAMLILSAYLVTPEITIAQGIVESNLNPLISGDSRQSYGAFLFQRSKGKILKTYRVYIEQINQQYYDVKANSRDAAIPKAEREWRKENGPCCRCVEEQYLK